MVDNHDTERFQELWADIPDPVRAPPSPKGVSATAPAIDSPTRAEVHRRRLWAFCVCVIWTAVVLRVFGPRQGLAEALTFLANQTVVWAAFIAASAFAALSKGRKGLGESVRLVELTTLAAPVAFAILALFWVPADRRRSFAELGPPLQALACFSVGLVLLAPMLVVSIWSIRRAFPSAAGWRGAALGAACGLGAALVLTLHCAVPFMGHVVLAHGGPLLIGAVAGALAGARFARI